MSDIVKDDTQAPSQPSLIHQIEDVLRDTRTLNGLTIGGLNHKITAFTRAPLLLEQALVEIKALQQRHADTLDALNRMTDQRDEALGGQPAIELPQHRLRVAIQEAAEYNEMIPLHTDDPHALHYQQMVKRWLDGKGMHPQQVDRVGQLVTQLKDATAQCGVMADLLRTARTHYDNALENGDFSESSDIEHLVNQIDEIDAILAGQLPERRITKPARVWGARFRPGIPEQTIIEAAYRYAEHESSPEEKEAGKINFNLLMAAVHKIAPEGWQLVPVEPTENMVGHGCGASVMVVSEVTNAWAAMLAAAPKPQGREKGGAA